MLDRSVYAAVLSGTVVLKGIVLRSRISSRKSLSMI